MSTETSDAQQVPDSAHDDERDAVTAAEVAVLREENERLRKQFKQARQTTYRRTALAFLIVGLIALAGGALFPDVRVLLVALGGTGVFAAILTFFITPEAFLAASVSEQIYAATARNGADLVSELGLQDARVYAPAGQDGVRLFIPAHREYVVPDPDALQSVFVVTDAERERGVALQPTGRELYGDFETAANEAQSLEEFTAQLGDAVVEQFELAQSVTTGVSPQANQARFEITGQSCGELRSFDQPVVSFLATGLATYTDQPVRIEFPDDSEPLLQCQWPGAEETE